MCMIQTQDEKVARDIEAAMAVHLPMTYLHAHIFKMHINMLTQNVNAASGGGTATVWVCENRMPLIITSATGCVASSVKTICRKFTSVCVCVYIYIYMYVCMYVCIQSAMGVLRAV